MWIARISLRFVFFFCCLGLSAAQALTPAQAIGMVQGETDNRLEVLNLALQEADAATAVFLQALADDAVKVAGKQVFVLRDGKAYDAVTAAEIPMPSVTEDVISNNRMRGEIDAALAALKLLNPDDKVRLQAAMALAKEQYGRRGETSNLWVVCSADVLEMDYADEDVFRTTPSKSYRDPAGYKVNDKIDAYKAKNQG